MIGTALLCAGLALSLAVSGAQAQVQAGPSKPIKRKREDGVKKSGARAD